MAGLRDQLIATGMTSDEWANAKPTKSKAQLKATIEHPPLTLPKPFNRKVPGVVEADVMAGVKDWLAYRATWVKRIQVEGVTQRVAGDVAIKRPSKMRGLPDWLAILDGALWGIEVKQPSGKLGWHQAKELERIAQGGGVGIVVTSVEGLDRAFKCRHQWMRLPPQGFPVWVF